MEKDKFYLDSMYHIPQHKVSHQRLRESLILYPQLFQGKADPVVLLRDEGTHWAVPRMWGLRQLWINPSKEYVDNTVFPEMRWPSVNFPGGFGYWPWQPPAIMHILEELVDGKGNYGTLLESAPGTGKTLMGVSIAALLHTPTLIVTHKEDLAEQWVDTVKSFFNPAKIGKIKQDTWDYKNKLVVMASAQTLHSRREEIRKECFDAFGLIIYDESHRYPARTFEEVLRLFNARYRLGVSATYRRKDGMECIWHYHIGNVGHRVHAPKLTGKYAQIDCKVSIVANTYKMYGKINSALLINAIADDPAYNGWLAEQVKKGAGVGRRVLLVSDRVSQIQDIERRVLATGCTNSIGLYCRSYKEGGKNKTMKKDDLLRSKQCDIILGTYKMISEGTDIPELDTLILATPRSEIEQVVGRIQRPKDGKRELLIVDPVLSIGYCEKLAKKREKMYDKLGFTKQVKE
jgi:superfamily II DNA or RNA helicase